MKVLKHTQGLQGPKQARSGLLPQKNQSVSGYGGHWHVQDNKNSFPSWNKIKKIQNSFYILLKYKAHWTENIES